MRNSRLKTLSVLLCICFVLPLFICNAEAADVPKFTDLSKSHWAYEYVVDLAKQNIISGYTDGSFKPGNEVLRSEWAKMLSAIAEDENAKGNVKLHATDYGYDDWFCPYIDKVAPYMNFYTINGKTYFKPHQPITREDVTVSLVKLMKYDTSEVDYSYVNAFSDSDSVSSSLKKYIAVAVEKKLVTGFDDNTFRGQDTLTRAEAATLLWRALQPQAEVQEKYVYADTLLKTNGVDIYNFAQFGDTLYIVDDDYIYYELDIQSLAKKKEVDLKELTFSHEGSKWVIDYDGYSNGRTSVCYNEASDSVLLSTYVKEVNPLSSFTKKRSCVLDLKALSSIPTDMQWNDSDVLLHMDKNKALLYGWVTIYKTEPVKNIYSLLKADSYDYLNGIRTNTGKYPIIKETDDAVYYVHENVANKYGINKYNFNEANVIIPFPASSNLSVAFSEFIWIVNRQSGMMYSYNYNGELVDEYDLKNVDVKDKTVFDVKNFSSIFFVSSDGKIVFYDTERKSVRVIF